VSVVVNRVRRGFYADSVMLMRISRTLGRFPGVLRTSLMIGSESNKALLDESGLLAGNARDAKADDLIVAVRARNTQRAEAALAESDRLLSSSKPAAGAHDAQPAASSLGAALAVLPEANLALISVPGEYAAAEARRALEHGLHVMVFSDNVPVAEEITLKRLAAERGLLVMGPDCGTALIGGVPLAFANAVPRGDVGIVSASGTGLQEVACLLVRAGRGVSHGIGVGGRDLSEPVGGLMTLAAFDALDADPATKEIIVISKPPAAAVVRKIVARAGRSKKPVTLCLLGAEEMKLPRNAKLARTLEEAAGVRARVEQFGGRTTRAGRIRGLYCGGTLCAEARIVLGDMGVAVGAADLVDLGDDAYTRGRPHPMIEPALRTEALARALRDKSVAVVLLDVVIGYGAHADPAGLVAAAVRGSKKTVIASVTGTEDDPQRYSAQVGTLRGAGVLVAVSNAAAARLAGAAVGAGPRRRAGRRAPGASAKVSRKASSRRR
jgi:FdrA protein